jgi:hypothetical protein
VGFKYRNGQDYIQFIAKIAELRNIFENLSILLDKMPHVSNVIDNFRNTNFGNR